MQALHEQERIWVLEWLILKSYLFMYIYKHYLPHFQFQFNSGTLENERILPSKPYINCYACRLTETTFGAEITLLKSSNFTNN